MKIFIYVFPSFKIRSLYSYIFLFSALLVDVNGDGQQDLISYFVTYRPVNEEDHSPDGVKNWELQSNVRVVYLEAELPKLYDAVSKH